MFPQICISFSSVREKERIAIAASIRALGQPSSHAPCTAKPTVRSKLRSRPTHRASIFSHVITLLPTPTRRESSQVMKERRSIGYASAHCPHPTVSLGMNGAYLQKRAEPSRGATVRLQTCPFHQDPGAKHTAPTRRARGGDPAAPLVVTRTKRTITKPMRRRRPR